MLRQRVDRSAGLRWAFANRSIESREQARCVTLGVYD